MKIVHSADMVAHLWANRSQDTARTSSQNFYFNGPVIYSYGPHFPVAVHLEDGAVLFNGGSYSNTTNRHKTHVWRAMSAKQSAARIDVPSMSYDALRDLQRLRESGDGRKLPKLAETCANSIIDIVESMSKMREGKGPISSAFHRIRVLYADGVKLCEYVRKGKRAPKFPIDALPAEIPAGEALKLFIRSIAKKRLVECHAGAIGEALRGLDRLESELLSVDGWRIQNLPGELASIGRMLNNAGKWYESAHGRKCPKTRALWKRQGELSPRVDAVVTAWAETQARAEIRAVSRDIYKMLRTRVNAAPGKYSARRDSGYYFGKLKQALQVLPAEESARYSELLGRIGRCNTWDTCANGLDSARSDIANAESYGDKYPGDAMRHYVQALQYATQAKQNSEQFAQLYHAELLEIRTHAEECAEKLRADIAAKHARAVDDWKAGIINSLPFDAGTFARIKGDIVQTSRGASVPIEHACRLARIARRVIKAGGKEWANGAGPMVGSFRVHSIGADGATVIGCHTFDAAESLRVLALLESCAHCAEVLETEGVA